MRTVGLLVMAVALSGCMATDRGAEMVTPSYSGQYAPINDSGLIKYSLSGDQYAVEQRREDAYRQMWTRCNGRYRVLSEYSERSQKEESEAMMVSSFDPLAGAFFHGGAKGNMVIRFECVQ